MKAVSCVSVMLLAIALFLWSTLTKSGASNVALSLVFYLILLRWLIAEQRLSEAEPKAEHYDRNTRDLLDALMRDER